MTVKNNPKFSNSRRQNVYNIAGRRPTQRNTIQLPGFSSSADHRRRFSSRLNSNRLNVTEIAPAPKFRNAFSGLFLQDRVSYPILAQFSPLAWYKQLRESRGWQRAEGAGADPIFLPTMTYYRYAKEAPCGKFAT